MKDRLRGDDLILVGGYLRLSRTRFRHGVTVANLVMASHFKSFTLSSLTGSSLRYRLKFCTSDQSILELWLVLVPFVNVL